jgi:hypothetical protein
MAGAEALPFFGGLAFGFRVSRVERFCPLATTKSFDLGVQKSRARTPWDARGRFLLGGLRLIAVDGLEVGGFGLAALALDDVVGQALVLLDAVQPGLLDGRRVDERVGSAVVRRDEPETLLVIEKFYGADWHVDFLSVLNLRRGNPFSYS